MAPRSVKVAKEEMAAHLHPTQRGRIDAGVAPDRHCVTHVGLAGAGPKITQLDKLPETIYGLVVWQ